MLIYCSDLTNHHTKKQAKVTWTKKSVFCNQRPKEFDRLAIASYHNLAHLVLSRAWWGSMLRWYWAATAFNMSVAARATREASMHLTRFSSVKNHFMDPAELQFTRRGRHSTWAWSSWKLNDGARSGSSDSLAYLCERKKRTRSMIRCASSLTTLVNSLWLFLPVCQMSLFSCPYSPRLAIILQLKS